MGCVLPKAEPGTARCFDKRTLQIQILRNVRGLDDTSDELPEGVRTEREIVISIWAELLGKTEDEKKHALHNEQLTDYAHDIYLAEFTDKTKQDARSTATRSIWDEVWTK
eukprot:CAMPEP_0203781238 /NCGR_PEP_ID=MMETSP0099_2-20121227/10076_1 /ASSEMBLY_ACC=CAM_ASM_000209 /TAXON_ID=96639 /ORGANISM=" , Strain NY0313808BC1" /LENGTH=109 /DNA_ID=CAMNT_0050682105 /DNA_START=89 /DNA_END=415 /DNA_ORIENTATION=-